MMRRDTMFSAFLLAPALLLAAAGAAQAQGAPAQGTPAQGFGLEANAGYYTLGGDDFEALDEAVGFEAIASWAWANGFELGLGAGISGHDFEETIGGADADADLIGVFLQPVYRFNAAATASPHIHPFLGARVGYARLSSEIEEGGIEVSDDANGFSAGGVGGLEVWLSDEVGVTGSVLFDFLSFGEVDDVDESDASGTRLGFRGGLKVRFP